MTGRMWKIVLSPALVLMAGLFYWHCSENPTSSDLSADRSPDHAIMRSKERVAESANRFGLKLFREINQQEGDQNIFVSPLSVSMALGMTYNGAAGGTRAAMAQTLELAGLSIEEVNKIYGDMLIFLPQLDPNVQLEIANSIWYRQDYESPRADFLDICHQCFQAQVTGMDFNAPDAADIINAWVAEQTHGKITEIVDDPIDPYICMFLIDAIYFQGLWQYQFDENSTLDWPFHRLDGSEISCRLMNQRNLFRHYYNDDLLILEMPYGDGIFNMTVVIPRGSFVLDELIAQLEPEILDDLLNNMAIGDSVDVFIPRFTIEYGLGMDDALKALGMEVAFQPHAADFGNMYPGGGVWLGQTRHKTFIEVTESGTDASSAASIVVWMGPGQPPKYIANRPFLFLIRENEYDTILFIGKLVDPTAG